MSRTISGRTEGMHQERQVYIDKHIMKEVKEKKCSHGVDWLQIDVWYGHADLDKNVLDVWQSHKLHHESYGKRESGINNRRTNPSRWENPKRHLSRRLIFTNTICYSNDATQVYTKEFTGGNKFKKSQKKIKTTLCIKMISRYLSKIEKKKN